MKAVRSFETSANNYPNTRHNNPEDVSSKFIRLNLQIILFVLRQKSAKNLIYLLRMLWVAIRTERRYLKELFLPTVKTITIFLIEDRVLKPQPQPSVCFPTDIYFCTCYAR